MKWTSAQHAAVSVEGYLAGIAGRPRRANPYKLGTISALWWFQNWYSGRAKRARNSLRQEPAQTPKQGYRRLILP